MVKRWFNTGREVINRQIEAYDPQIILGCAPHIPQIFPEVGMDRQKREARRFC